MTIEAMKQALEALKTASANTQVEQERLLYEAAIKRLRNAIDEEIFRAAPKELIPQDKLLVAGQLGANVTRVREERQWQGLTKQEFLDVVDGLEDLEDCWVAIEAKLKEKNG